MTVSAGTFKELSSVIHAGDLISGDRFLELATSQSNLHYFKRDFLYRRGTWRGVVHESLFGSKELLKGGTVVFGHSDIPTGRLDISLIEKLFKVKRIFGTNLLAKQNISIPIPLGITNMGVDGPFHNLLGDPELFLRADEDSDFLTHFEPTIYANFSVANNIRTRGELMKVLSSLPRPIRVEFSIPEFTKSARLKYLDNCRRSAFVVCPEGNGFDTHRLWETLYMGGVPVVRKNNYISPLIAGLPVLQVRNWAELQDLGMLEQAWERIKQEVWDFSPLNQRHWEALIAQS